MEPARGGRPATLVARQAPDEQARERVDHQRDDEQHQPDLDERVQVELVGRLRELVGDDRGHRVLRREERDRQLRRVADDHRHGHRLAQRPAERPAAH